MESFFFNITDRSYKITKEKSFNRVDISNGIVFLDIHAFTQLNIQNIDRMIILVIVQEGKFSISDHLSQKEFISHANTSEIFCTTRQDLTIKAEGDAFILFIADFFLKRYLLSTQKEPIDFLYQKLQNDISLISLDKKTIDALSLYLINKITARHQNMNSIRCEHNVMELMIHRFLQLDIFDTSIGEDELTIAKRAKTHLLHDLANPPTISELAHKCATNESKLKMVFKKVYQTTIYNYIQKQRLEMANLLLMEQIYSIGEIAHKVGYKHQGHFSKLFFKNFGVYPKDLLKKQNSFRAKTKFFSC
ncbi:AraC family transcriptional regulator [Sulfurimonas sp. HSL-1716]|uniref:helix-turn-helix transcriptional regulator n=1 Tax=Hydrocurvibacter sulfurireducens TaxID=3131937 RepID=UPI0031F871DD